MWQFIVGLVVGFALGWWLDWYLSRQESLRLREEMVGKSATIAGLQKELLAHQQQAMEPSEGPISSQPSAVEALDSVTAYCVKCRKTREISNPRRVTLSNGRPALKGTCPVCERGLFRLIKA